MKLRDYLRSARHRSGKINALSSITVLGDSLMANGNPPFTGSNPASGGGMSPSHIGWANDKLREMGLPGFDILNFRAVGGKTLVDCYNEQVPSAVTDATDGAWAHIGVNSFNSSIAGNDTLANNIIKAKQIVDALSAAKKFVIFDSIDPVNQSGITGAKGRATEFPQFNAAMKAYCDAKPNVIWLDTYSVMIDPASPQLNPLPGLIQVYDGIHRTTKGAQVSGYSVVSKLVSRLNITRYKSPGSNLLSPMGTTGGTSTPASGTISGSVPANWNIQNVAGSANVTLSVVNGKTRIVATNPAASAAVIYLQATNNAALAAACALGLTVQGGFDFNVISATSMTRLAGSLRINGSTGLLWNVMQRDTTLETASDFVFADVPFTGRRFINPLYFSSAATTAEFIIQIALDAVVGATATIDISNPTFVNLT